MAIELVTYITIGVLFSIAIVVGWILSGRTRVFLDMGLILLVSLIVLLASFQIYDDDPVLANLGFIISAGILVIIGLRTNITYIRPINKMRKELKKIEKTNDYSNLLNLSFTGGYDRLAAMFAVQISTIENLLEIIKKLTKYEKQIDAVDESVVNLSQKLEDDSSQLTDDIDTNLQSAVLGNEISERLQGLVRELSEEFIDYNHKLAKQINFTDILSDQTNLVAVNAAIEAAHSESEGENFGIVADGIQRLSSRSRETAIHLSKINTELNRMMTDKINKISQEFANLDNIIFQIADLSDRVSNISHQQRGINAELNMALQELHSRKSELDALREDFKY